MSPQNWKASKALKIRAKIPERARLVWGGKPPRSSDHHNRKRITLWNRTDYRRQCRARASARLAMVFDPVWGPLPVIRF